MKPTEHLDKVIPFAMSASDAEKLSHIPELATHNLPVSAEDTAPFTMSVLTDYPAGRSSRFSLPLLSFQGEPVAALGFRNKDGFLLIRSGLPDQVEMAVATRMRGLIGIAKRGLRALAEERKDLTARAHSILESNGEPIVRMRGFEFRRGFLDVVHVQTQLDPSQVYNRLVLAMRGADRRQERRGVYSFCVSNPAFNLTETLVSFHGTHGGSLISTRSGLEGLVLRAIVTGEDLLAERMRADEVREEFRRTAPMSEREVEDAWPRLAQSLRCPNEHRAVGPYSIDVGLFGGCLMRDGLIMAEIGRSVQMPSPDARAALQRFPGLAGKLSRIVLTAAGVIREPEAELEGQQHGEWGQALEEAVRSTDFGYA